MAFEMTLPAELVSLIEVRLGNIKNVAPVGGGDISNAARVQFADDQQVLVKWHKNSPPGFFSAERRGLELLDSTRAMRVPQVLAHSEAGGGCPAFIVLEWLGRGASTDSVAEVLGHGLAMLHRSEASNYGLDHDNYIGANPQSNGPGDDWVIFFRDQRLGCQMELAGKNGRLPTPRAQRLEKLLGRLESWLPAHPPVSLLHGDLWGGNWLVTQDNEPALIDPAVYYGHREAELAFTELFGGFSALFYHAYNESWPLDGEYSERRDLYNLYHLLNHLNLFGETYGAGVDSVLRNYVG
jgi:fructosamine-3-kinase